MYLCVYVTFTQDLESSWRQNVSPAESSAQTRNDASSTISRDDRAANHITHQQNTS